MCVALFSLDYICLQIQRWRGGQIPIVEDVNRLEPYTWRFCLLAEHSSAQTTGRRLTSVRFWIPHVGKKTLLEWSGGPWVVNFKTDGEKCDRSNLTSTLWTCIARQLCHIPTSHVTMNPTEDIIWKNYLRKVLSALVSLIHPIHSSIHPNPHPASDFETYSMRTHTE